MISCKDFTKRIVAKSSSYCPRKLESGPDPGTKCLQVDIFMNVCNKCAMFGESGEGRGRRRRPRLKEFPESQCNVNDK